MERFIIETVNQWFGNNPGAYLVVGWISLLLYALVVRGLPWWLKRRKAVRENWLEKATEEDRQKQESREAILDTQRDVKGQKDAIETLSSEFKRMNGSVRSHHDDKLIHVSFEELMRKDDCIRTHELLQKQMQSNAKNAREERQRIEKRMDTGFDTIFNKLDVLAKELKG